jgi:glycosyltransferase involved in cell wall biosynthesis
MIGGKGSMTIDNKLDLGIAIPTLNCIETLRDTVESLRRLREHGARVVVADSYSTDGTYEFAKSSVDQVIQVPKGNLYAAVNAALEPMDVEWMTYINGDDLLYAGAVEQALAQWASQADLIYGNTDFVDIDGRFLHSWRTPPPNDFVPMAANHVMPITQPGTLFRKAVFKKLNGFDTTFRHSADFDFFLRAKIAGFRFKKHPGSSTSAFRLHGKQFSQTAAKDQHAETLVLVQRQNLKVSFLRRKMAMLRYKLRNSENYLIRMLRYRSLMGRCQMPRSVVWFKNDPESDLRSRMYGQADTSKTGANKG